MKKLKCVPKKENESNYFEEEIGKVYEVETDENGNEYVMSDDGTSIYLDELEMEDYEEVK